MDAPTTPTPSSTPLTPNQRRTLKAGYMRIKHGLHSTRAVIPGESLEEFQAFRHEMVLYLMPGDPLENAMAEQLVMIQWKLRRLWASQTGVYRNHAEHQPVPETSPTVDTFPQRTAKCVHDDNAQQGDLHRLNLEEQRLVNLFAKVMTKYEQHGQQRRKRLQAGAKWNYVETEEYYPAPDGTLAHRMIPPVYDMDPLSRRREPEPLAPEASLPAAEAPEAAPEARATEVAPMSTSDSKDEGSGEITDRRRSEATDPAALKESPANVRPFPVPEAPPVSGERPENGQTGDEVPLARRRSAAGD